MRLEKVSRVVEKGLIQHEDHAPDSADAEAKMVHWTIIPELFILTIARPLLAIRTSGRRSPRRRPM